jgi:hypothetical protein
MSKYFNVAPRYTCGSPAMVSAAIALRVADEEKEGYAVTLEGVYGPEAKALAERAGLRRIAEAVIEKADCWLVHDLITQEDYIRPFTVDGETPARHARRLLRLRGKYRLPLATELQNPA